MKSFIAATIAGVISAGMVDVKFMEHVTRHSLSYGTMEEFEFRRTIFEETEAFIKEENAKNLPYTVGHNKFSTWTQDEKKRVRGLKQMPEDEEFEFEGFADDTNDLPSEVNWITAGGVTPVKDQGNCGSCWAFSSVGALEGAHFVKSGELLSFSEQQLVDCDTNDSGCRGGLQHYAMKYWETSFAELESAYPYTAKHGKCAYNKASATAVEVTNYRFVAPRCAYTMKKGLVKQPLSVSVDADANCFMYYTSGVVDNPRCGTSLDHAVLAVGYGVDEASGLEYWLIKNSWGTSWGDQGYIRLAITESGKGTCGVQMWSLYPNTNE